MAVLFPLAMGLGRCIGAGAVKGVTLLAPRMAILAAGRPTHFGVTFRATLVVGSLESHYVVVVSALVLLAQGGCRERLDEMAAPAGHARSPSAVLVALHAIGIRREGAGRVVMAFGTVLDEHYVLAMVEVHLLVKIHQGIEFQGIRRGFGTGVGRGHDQGQHEDPPD